MCVFLCALEDFASLVCRVSSCNPHFVSVFGVGREPPNEHSEVNVLCPLSSMDKTDARQIWNDRETALDTDSTSGREMGRGEEEEELACGLFP